MTREDLDFGPSLRELQEALREASTDATHFRQFFELCPLPCGIYHKGCIAYINPAFIRILGCERDKVVGRKWEEMVCVSCESVEHITARLKEAGDEGEQWETLTYIKCDGGRVKFYASWVGDGFDDTAYAVFVPAAVAEGLL